MDITGIRPALQSERSLTSYARMPVTAIIALGATIAFFTFRRYYEGAVHDWEPLLAIPFCCISLALAFAFVWVRYEAAPSLFLNLLRITAAGVFFYLVVEPPSFTNTNDSLTLIRFVNIGYWLALLAAFSSLWRPSFLFPAGNLCNHDCSREHRRRTRSTTWSIATGRPSARARRLLCARAPRAGRAFEGS